MKRFFNISLLSIMLSLVGGIMLMSCRDDLLYDNSLIGEGEANVDATLTFHPMEVGLDTRSSGTAINSFNNVCVVIYNATNGEFVKKFMANEIAGYNYEPAGNTSYPTDTPTGHPGNDPDSEYDHNSQASTPKATFTLKDLPFGKYRIYAVANLGMLSDAITESEETLKGHKVDWKNDVSQDNSMFGYFTLAENEKWSSDFNAPEIVVNKSNIKLHCWMKRTASKVTIAFDPSGLKEAVTVYIRSVRIHDIAKECTIGMDNKPDSEEDLIHDGEIFYYGDGQTNATAYDGWLKLQKGTGVQGTKDHLETDNALYFYENMQGDYEGQKTFLKQQIKDETGNSINEPEKDDDGNVITDEDGNMKTDFKDRVPYGTYIEVEGYYVSQNTEKLSKGPIKYRFMLGQNTTYNYNAQRNCHYKLTLKFRGWANQPDWHIVYDELEPSIIVPDPYYISYLYNQDMTYPVRVTGIDYIRQNDLHLHAQIIKNNWIPTVEGTGALAPQIIGAYNDIEGFAWNKWAYDNTYAGANYAGFLSLRRNTLTIVGANQVYGVAGNEYLLNNYEGKTTEQPTPRYYADYEIQNSGIGLGVSGNTGDGTYDVKDMEDNSMTINLPMFTRPKELIPASDFSGNNPFQAYVREATVRFSLRKRNTPNPTSSAASGWSDAGDVLFKVKDENGNEKEVKYVDVTIYQVPRIVNPKAIWRKWDSEDEFHVELKQLNSAGSSNYSNFKSEGPWRVSILQDPDGLIKIYTADGQEVTKSKDDNGNPLYIKGSTGTEVDFWYKPNGTAGGANNARCGIIKVEYHDYTCHHLIFVRQGYDKGMKLGTATWSCYNAYAAGSNATAQAQTITSTNVVVTTSPLSIGSMFKRCNYNYAIRESNNSNYGWLRNVGTSTTNLSTAYRNGTSYSTRNSGWSAISGYPWSSTRGNKPTGPQNQNDTDTRAWADTWYAVNKSNVQLAVPTYEEYASLRDNCEYGYGVVYADGATSVATTIEEAQGYTDYNNTGASSTRGMRACIVYNSANADQVMFPIGDIGQGRRSRTTYTFPYSATYNGTNLQAMVPNGTSYAGSLTYSGIGGLLYRPSATGARNDCRPLTYNLYREPGAIYWFKRPYRKPWASTPDNDNRVAAWDINYYTLVFNHYDSSSLAGLNDNGTQNTTNTSDALPIKFIYK